MNKWLKSINVRNLQLAKTKWGVSVLFVCAFADASFFPMLAPVLFLALVLIDITKTYRYAIIAISGTFAGALAGYAIGHFAWFRTDGELTGLSEFMLAYIPGFTSSSYDKIHIFFDKWDIWILSLASLLPIPYKYFSISSGVFDINLILFSSVTLAVQTIKFFILGLLIKRLGPEVRKLLEFNLKPAIIIVLTFIAIIVVATKVF
jgi:membrane protein YqaA with SNARE-associated domain